MTHRWRILESLQLSECERRTVTQIGIEEGSVILKFDGTAVIEGDLITESYTRVNNATVLQEQAGDSVDDID